MTVEATKTRCDSSPASVSAVATHRPPIATTGSRAANAPTPPMMVTLPYSVGIPAKSRMNWATAAPSTAYASGRRVGGTMRARRGTALNGASRATNETVNAITAKNSSHPQTSADPWIETSASTRK